MAARCQATSSTPAFLIYAQSWPVPSHRSFGKRYPENPASNSHKKSINSPWISEVKKHKTTTQRVSSPAVNVRKLHSWTSSMLNNHYPEWIEEDTHAGLDMAKEFKLTLQMFKKLTQQVKEVDEQLNSKKQPCTFKHYFTSKDGPGIYRSQLAANMRSFSPEIPMTNQPYQPCDNFGYKKKLRRPHTHLGIYRTNDNKITPKSKADNLPMSNSTCVTNSNVCKTQQENHLKKQRYQYPLTSKPDSLETSNREFSSSEFNDEANEEFGYIDPVPVDWDKIKLEEIDQAFCSDKKDKVDPFITRYLQLRRLEADTLENERYNPRSGESIENLCNLNKDSHKTNGHSQGKKICGINGKHSSKTSVEKIKMGEKSSKHSVNISKKSIKSNSPYVHSVSASGFKSDLEITSKYRKSCFSQFGEGNLKKAKQTDTSLRKKQNKTTSCSTKRSKCSSAGTVRKISDGRMVYSPSSHQSCSVAIYDIVQLASSFDPPCKERIKSMSRPVTAKSKGLLPGKSWNSQRRFSLTSNQTFQPIMANETCMPLVNKSSSSKGRQKSAKKTTRRCASSKL